MPKVYTIRWLVLLRRGLCDLYACVGVDVVDIRRNKEGTETRSLLSKDKIFIEKNLNNAEYSYPLGST